MSTLTVVYATDEDVATYAGEDYSLLVPSDQILASGSDGIFLSSDLWTLNSASTGFAAYGVQPGMLCRLIKPTTSFGAQGQLLAVASVAANAVTLRRRAMPVNVTGQPPAPAGGLTSVTFEIGTLFATIESVSYALNRKLGIDDTGRGLLTNSLWDVRELREACVYGTLARRYRDMAHVVDDGDAFKAKSDIYGQQFSDMLDNLYVRLNDVAGRQPMTSRQGRLIR